MIYFNFTIRNPWSSTFKHRYAKSGMLSKHKAWEFEVYQCDNIAEIEAKVSVREDHAGVMLSIGLFSYVATFQLYDTRHWDYKEKKWMCYD